MQVGPSYLFPLSKLNNQLDCYFVSSRGEMFSTKQSPVGRSMIGTGLKNTRYYTMNGTSYSGANLYRRAQQHADWKVETSKPASTFLTRPDHPATQSKITDRSHSPDVEHGIKNHGFVICQVAMHEDQEHLLFGSKPVIHLTEQSYKDEMIRLATSKPGMKFVALKIVASVVSGGIKWE